MKALDATTTSRRALAVALSLACALPVASTASAQSRAAADVLFDDGKALMAEKRFAEACPKFAASQKIDPAPGTLVWLADCYEQNGQTASAWSTYREALAAAKAARQPAREALATERIAALQKVLSKIVLDIQSPAIPGLTVTIDGVAVNPTLWTTPTPFDPGPHAIEATAPGYVSFTQRLTLAKATNETVVVPPLVRAEPVPTPSASAAVAATSAGPPPAPPASTPRESATDAPPRTSAMKPAGVAIASVGAIAVVVGVVVQLGARSLASEAIDDCRAHVRCSSADLAKHDRAASRQTLALIAGGVGAGMLVAGGVLVWRSPTETTKVWVTPAVGAGAGGLSITRSW